MPINLFQLVDTGITRIPTSRIALLFQRLMGLLNLIGKLMLIVMGIHHVGVNDQPVFLINHRFAESGDYIGIVTAKHPTMDRTYTAVFPFHVGETNLGYVPLFVGIALLIQLNYWLMTGGFSRWRDKRRQAVEA